MSTPILVADRLRKVYGRVVAVDEVSLSVEPGTLVGLVGPNGAGKSTTIRMISGQLTPSSGRVTVGGVDVATDPNGARARIGYVPEEPKLYEYLTAREMVSFVAEIRGGGDVEAALAVATLDEDALRPIQEYSQGMRRKTALACALVSRPPLYVLDEALNGLDPPSAARVTAALRRVCDEGASVILSTHVLDTLEKIADRLVMIASGRVIADVPGSEMERVRALFG